MVELSKNFIMQQTREVVLASVLKQLKNFALSHKKLFYTMRKNKICVFLCTIFFTQPLCSEQPFLSSKAVRVAIKAKESIQGKGQTEIAAAVSSLESLLQDASFLRLDPEAQIDILLLLSRGYERVERFTDQERFLLRYAKKRELYRYHVLLKTALIRSYIHQDRIFEAEHLLAKLTKPSLTYASLEEKIEIAKTIVFIEDTLRTLLLSAETQAKNGQIEESIKKYKTVLASIEKYYFPFQASSVEKKHLQSFLIVRIAELNYLLGNHEQASVILSAAPQLSTDSPGMNLLIERHTFLVDLVNSLKNGKTERPIFHPKSFCPFENTAITPEYLSWQAHEAIMQEDIPALSAAITTLSNKKNEELSPLIYILEGFKEALLLKVVPAYENLFLGTLSQNQWTIPWKESSLNLLANLGWQRACILALSKQENQARDICHKILQRIQNTHCPDLQAKAVLFQNLLFALDQDKKIDFSETSMQEASWPLKTSLITSYCNAINSYQQALKEDLSEEEALLRLEKAAGNVSDAIPEILCYRIELLIRCGRIEEACTLSLALLQDYKEYTLTPSSIALCLLAIEPYERFSSEYQLFMQYLYTKPLSPEAFLLTFKLFETKKELPEIAPPPQKETYYSLQKMELARKYLKEIAKSKEAGFIKENIEKANIAFFEAEMKIQPLLTLSQEKESSAILYGYLFSLYAEQINALEQAILSRFAFSGLPSLITETASRLSYDCTQCHDSKNDLLLEPKFLEEITSLASTSGLYAYAFTRNFDAVFALVENYPPSLFRVSKSACRGCLFAAKGLYESHTIEKAYLLLSHLDETTIKEIDYELALEIAIEKSLCLREMKQGKKAMSLLAWVINSPCVSSLRIKAMVLRADMYLAMNREELAIKQLESVVNKGGEWGAVAERKLRELEKVDGSS